MRLSSFLVLAMLAISADGWAQARRPATQDALPAGPTDGRWRGQSDPGSCNQPMDVNLVIEGGTVEGTGRESSGKTALLWNYHGRTRPNGTIELLGHASAFPPQQAKQAKLAGRVDGARIQLSESGGCGRSVTLSR